AQGTEIQIQIEGMRYILGLRRIMLDILVADDLLKRAIDGLLAGAFILIGKDRRCARPAKCDKKTQGKTGSCQMPQSDPVTHIARQSPTARQPYHAAAHRARRCAPTPQPTHSNPR